MAMGFTLESAHDLFCSDELVETEFALQMLTAFRKRVDELCILHRQHQIASNCAVHFSSCIWAAWLSLLIFGRFLGVWVGLGV